ncbi:phosphoribosylglycinamide formyltransferase [Rubripirellula reticaptiva]|uniref:phosphoribosylglycinamide formyltransferase 1 n=1 Tax=Rubripirellula reticaptiva TaxID=2528013 RepID=A0A5C6EKS0_9BACT|nr:phosphoribosylglycinamide formyltransferase [Rubripirellula reticaptiva]TWU47909.1 Phosphoribosylglycinamide formyltransferase [Rubripirellula reticaptiva]
MSEQAKPVSVAVFLSGGGRTLENLIVHRDQHALPIDLRLVISSSGKVRGVDVGRDAGIPTEVILKKDHPDSADYCRAMFDPVRKCGAEIVVMAGFLKHVLVPDDFTNRVINIHPSLLPAFGGPGMYGSRVHTAAINRGVQVSGCTVHYVDNHYDNGPIILQRWCAVKPGDTPDSLAAKVFDLECEALPAAIRIIASK